MATTGRRCNPALAARRRALLCLAGAAASFPAVLRSQQQSPKTVVWLGVGGEKPSAQEDAARKRIREGFRSRGIHEGRDIKLIFRELPGGRVKESDELAESLVRSRPHVIVSVAHAVIWSLRKRTRDIPVVFYNLASNPVTLGIVDSLARPGGNLTGSTQMADEFGHKQMQMFKELVPGLKRVGVVLDREEFEDAQRAEPELVARQRSDQRNVAASLGIEIVELIFPSNASRDEVARAVKRSGVHGLLGHSSPEVEEFVFTASIPAMCFGFRRVKKGCLFGWSFEWLEGESYAVQAVERILRGESPASIPVYQTPIRWAVNRKRARELGLPVPPALLISASEIYD